MRILSNKKRKNVRGLNEQGFTMLEMLFSFSLFCLMVTFLPPLFQIVFNDHGIEARIQKMEWELFISQTKKEIQSSDFVDVLNGELTLIRGDETISYQKYQNLLRRQVNRKGHEVLLQNVRAVSFEKYGNGIKIEVSDLFKRSNVAIIYPFISTTEMNGDGIR